MDSVLVSWQLKESTGRSWVLSMVVGGQAFDVVRVEARDKDAAALLVAKRLALLLRE